MKEKERLYKYLTNMLLCHTFTERFKYFSILILSMKEKISITLEKEVLNDIDEIVDHIYIKNRSHAIESLVRKALGENKTAVILAGGNPNLLRISAKDYRPTVKIKGKYLIEYQILKLRETGFNKIFIIGRKEILSAIFEILGSGEEKSIKIVYLEEKEANGTAESLRLLKGKINTPFLVVFCDIIFNQINIKELWNSHIKHNYVATVILTTSPTPYKKGIVKLEGTSILEFTQKPKQADVYIGFSSIFVSEPRIFDFEGASLEKDVFPQLAKKGLLGGHVSSEKEIHIHTMHDVLKVDNIVF